MCAGGPLCLHVWRHSFDLGFELSFDLDLSLGSGGIVRWWQQRWGNGHSHFMIAEWGISQAHNPIFREKM